MCLTVPGKVIEIKENSYIVDYMTERREVEVCLVDIKVGDYCIISNKIILAKVPEEKALKFMELINGT